jgi:hypothetical protein
MYFICPCELYTWQSKFSRSVDKYDDKLALETVGKYVQNFWLKLLNYTCLADTWQAVQLFIGRF